MTSPPMGRVSSKSNRGASASRSTPMAPSDGRPSAHFEHTVAVTEEGHEVLTLRPDGGATH